MTRNNVSGRSRKGNPVRRLMDQARRAIAYLLCFSMVLTNLPGSLIIAGAETEDIIAEEEEEETYVEIYSMTLDSLCDAAEDAIRYSDPMTGEEYLFAGDDAEIFDAEDGLIFEVYPETEGEDSLTLKTFVKLGKNELEKYSKLSEEDEEYEEEEDEDEENESEDSEEVEEDSDTGYEDFDLSYYNVTGNEEIIFLLINNTDAEVSARVRVITSDIDDAEEDNEDEEDYDYDDDEEDNEDEDAEEDEDDVEDEDDEENDDDEDIVIYETSVITIPANHDDKIVYSDFIVAEEEDPAILEYITVDEKEENAGIASLSSESGSNAEKESSSRSERAAAELYKDSGSNAEKGSSSRRTNDSTKVSESSSNAAVKAVEAVESASNAIKINTYSDDATPMKGTWYGSLTVDGMKAAAFVTTLSKFGVSYEIKTMATTGDAGISSFSVSAQIDGTEPWDNNNNPGNDTNASNNIVRTFDYVNYTLAYTTELSGSNEVINRDIYVEFTIPCGPDVASFNMGTLNWVTEPVITYYLPGGGTTTEYTNGMEVEKQVLTGHRSIEVPGTGTLSVGLYIGAAKNGTTLKPTFTAWIDQNSEEDKVTAQNVQTLTISAAQKYNIAFRQSSEMNISGTYDISTGNEFASKDTISGNTSLRGRMQGYGITVMLQNDADDKGLKGLEFPDGDTDTITFDLTLSELSENKSGSDLTNTAGYTPLIWDYDANLRKTAANGGSVGQWGRTWVYTNSANMDCAYQAAPFNKLGCHTYSTVYDSCYDGGDWHMEQDSTNPFVYHVTVSNYTFDYENYNFPSTYNTWYARTEPGTTYSAKQACFSSGTIQVVLQFPEEAVDTPTHIYYQMVADNFKVGETGYDVKATYTNTYELVPEGSIQAGVNFTDDKATNRATAASQLGTYYTSGDAYSFIGADIRLWGYVGTSTDRTVRTNATLLKFDASAFDINPDDSYTKNGHYAHGSGEGKVNSYTFYFAGKEGNWENDTEMSNTLINSTDLTYYSSLDALEAAGLTCVGILYIADVENVNNSSQSQCAIGLTVKSDPELINNVYAACNDAWASYSTIEELEAQYGAFVTDEGKINTELATKGYDLYRAYCSADTYATMGKSSTADESYKKTTYDNDGNITGGHDVGYYGGTSLLICGEKSTVTISTDKSVYDLDTGERTATVTVQPTVTVPDNYSTEGNTTTTTVTVTVTLDENITYSEGTAYWGDQAIIPVITTNADGSTVLTFTLENVTLGDTLDALTFDCTIGHAGTEEDIANNDTVSLEATIQSTNDSRAKLESYGNVADTSFNVIRLSSTSLSKSVNNRMIELNGSFIWTLSFYNGASEDVLSTEMVDVLPSNGDELESSFEGTYSVTMIELDFSRAQKSYNDDHEILDFYVSTDYTGTGKDLAKGEKPTTWEDLIHEETEYVTDDSQTHIITFKVPEAYQNMTAFYCDLGTLDAAETITIRLHVETSGNKPGDTYNNIFYEYATEQDEPVQSNLVTTQVVQRNISGRTWIDTNKNGLQDSGEPALANVTVTLYQYTDDVDPTGVRPLTGDQAKDVYGNTVQPVTTGTNGEYSFECLPAGTYRLEFSDVNGYIYEVTKANVGTNDQIDSDASEVSNENGNLISAISNVELPGIEDMDRYLYEDNYNDAGFSYITIDIEGTKVWDDADNQDGKRPASIDVYLLADGERMTDGHGNNIIAHVTPDADGNWTFKFTDLAKYNEDGKEIVYSIEEVSVDGYETKFSTLTEETDPDTGEGTGVYTPTIENNHIPETINISGSKVWEDADDQDGKRPESVTVNLLADGEAALDENGDAITATVTSDDNWAFSFTDLPKYKDGTEIQYNITEDAVDDYSTEITITKDEDTGDYTVTVTNSYTPEQTSISVMKVWDDENDQDGKRAAYIYVKLLADNVDTGKFLILIEENNWQGSFTELDVYTPVGQKIEYTVEEISIENYETVITEDRANGFVITNTHKPETLDISGEKVWDDFDNKDGKRSESVTINLLADGEPALDENGAAITATVTASDEWKFSFENLPKYKDGEEIQYNITEVSVEDYSTDITITKDEESSKYTVTVTNSYTPEQTSLTVTKVWDDANDQDGKRPKDINVRLLADEEETGKTVELSEANNWEDSFTGLDIYKDGIKISYSVEEVSVNGYETEIVDSDTIGFVITNTYKPETISISGSKTWHDLDVESPSDAHPSSITIYLMAGNTVVDTKVVSPDDDGNWIWSFTDLPKYENGEEINYLVVEGHVDDYTPSYTYEYDEDGNIITADITNTYTPGKTAITVYKDWADNSNQDGKRPASITVMLTATVDIDGTTTPVAAVNGDTIVLTPDNNWTHTFEDLYILYETEEGELLPIVYGVEELGDGDPYTVHPTVNVDGTNVFVIVNEYIPETTDIEVQKFWEDYDDKYGKRPESITVVLTAAYTDSEGVEQTGTYEKTVTAKNDWTAEFYQLPVYAHEGNEITYTIGEVKVDDYDVSQGELEKLEDGSYIVRITNTAHEYFPIDEEIVTDTEDIFDKGAWKKRDSVNEYNAIEFEMTTNLPKMSPEAVAEGEFVLTFHDVLDSELNLDEADADFSVYIAGKLISPAYYEVAFANTGTVYPASIRPLSSNASITDGCDFHVDVDLTKLYSDRVINDDAFNGNTEITIFFFADLEGTGLNGSYKSTVWYEVYNGETLEYTSNVDVVYVYTYEIDILKYGTDRLIDEKYEEAALAGAEFGVYYDDNCEEAVFRYVGKGFDESEKQAYTATSGDDGYVTFYGLAAGTYYVKELKAPEGYELSQKIYTFTLGSGENEDGETAAGDSASDPTPVANTPTETAPPPEEPGQGSEKNVDTDGDGDFDDDGQLVSVGDLLTYEITYVNDEDSEATVTITDHLDKGLDFVSAANDGIYDSSNLTITWIIENVAPGDEGYVTFIAKVNEKALEEDHITNTATIKIGESEGKDTNTVENSTHTSKSVDTDGDEDFDDNAANVKVGDELTYKITYKNTEDSTATVYITDVLEEGLTYVESSADCGGTYDKETRTLSWTIDNVQPDEEGSVEFKAIVNPTGGSNHSVSNTATVTVNNVPYHTNTTNNTVPSTSTSSSGGGGYSGSGGSHNNSSSSGPGAENTAHESSGGGDSSGNSIGTDNLGGLPQTGEGNVAMILIGVCIALVAVLVILLYMRRRTPDGQE